MLVVFCLPTPDSIAEGEEDVPQKKDDEEGESTKKPPELVSLKSVEEEGLLSNHPAKRNVLNFMRVMIVDSLSIQVAQKSSPVIDLLLDSQPEGTTHAQQCRYGMQFPVQPSLQFHKTCVFTVFWEEAKEFVHFSHFV